MKGIKILVGLAVFCGAVVFGRFQYVRASADIQRSHRAAAQLIDMQGDYEKIEAAAGVVGLEAVLRGTEAAVDYFEDGKLSQVKEAMSHARECDAEVSRPRGVLGKVFFSQPTACRSMFRALGEDASLEEAGVTFSRALADVARNKQRASASSRAARPGPAREDRSDRAAANRPSPGPEARSRAMSAELDAMIGRPSAECDLRITGGSLDIPQTKRDGRNWDRGDGRAPDSFVELRTPRGTVRSGVTKDSSGRVPFKLGPVAVDPGSQVTVTVRDKDLASHDMIFKYSVEAPARPRAGTWAIGDGVGLTLECARE